MKIHCIIVAYERYIPLEILIRCFVLQSSPEWVLHIVYDGPAPQGILDIVTPFLSDSRIHFYQSPERYQKYGHPNRRTMLQTIECGSRDFILLSNDDNMYVPRFVEFVLKEVKFNTGLIYCDTVHSHMEYNLHISQLAENFIDIGAFVVRADVAKITGFNYDHFSADGKYAEECMQTCNRMSLKAVKINKPLFIHN
jgi:hypothetical protein